MGFPVLLEDVGHVCCVIIVHRCAHGFLIDVWVLTLNKEETKEQDLGERFLKYRLGNRTTWRTHVFPLFKFCFEMYSL